MYAVIEDSGRQFKVEKNDVILVDVRSAEPGTAIVFDKVIAVGDGGILKTGGSSKVTGTVLGEEKGAKIIIGKFKRRKKMRRKTGHRQQYLRVRITDIAS